MNDPIPPCDSKSEREHQWEVVLRCQCCGFLIRCKNTPHDRSLVRDWLNDALKHCLRLWEKPHETPEGADAEIPSVVP